MKIENREVTFDDILSPITYVPVHAKGNPQHKDAELGVIYRLTRKHIKMLNCKTRTVQMVDPKFLMWG